MKKKMTCTTGKTYASSCVSCCRDMVVTKDSIDELCSAKCRVAYAAASSKRPPADLLEKAIRNDAFISGYTRHQRGRYSFSVAWKTGLQTSVVMRNGVHSSDVPLFAKWAKEMRENGRELRLITQGHIRCARRQIVMCGDSGTESWTASAIALGTAAAWGSMSPSTRLKVGAVIMSLDYREVLGIGYNGDEAGGPNVPRSTAPGEDGFLHAEENAILAMRHKQPGRLFVTHSPCEMCARRIINSGNIREVYYAVPYRDMSGAGLLITHGIPVVRLITVSDGRPNSPLRTLDLIRREVRAFG